MSPGTRGRATPVAGAAGRREGQVSRALVSRALVELCAATRALWRGLRAATGDDAYERYLRHQAEAHPGAPPLSRRAFFEAEEQRKWSRINRCC